MIKGLHLIGGEWVPGDGVFSNTPAQGSASEISVATPETVFAAVKAAEDAFASFSQTRREERAVFLDTIAGEIEARGEALTQIGCQETGLPEARLNGERGRTTGQLRMFAQHIRDGACFDRRHDEALPDRAPLPRPDLKMLQRPIGPVAVFGASNFPLAFSTAGGDTASALAAGCPVVVRGHTAHPGTADIVAQAILAAIAMCNMHPGVFGLIQGGDYTIGQALAQHPLIKAVGFTGSLRGGRALFDLCARRPEPIPFFGELGSINPLFMLPDVMANNADALGGNWAASLTMGAGQFCTNPGVVIAQSGPDLDRFVAAAASALEDTADQTMLSDGIACAYREGRNVLASASGVETVMSRDDNARAAAPALFRTTGDVWLANSKLHEEVFGPVGIVIAVRDQDQMLALARRLDGQLTACLHMTDADTDLGRLLMPVLERKAGRVLANGFPTGVEVCDAMVHGGPYPASTNFGATSVGSMAIRRFLRPVCYQGLPDALLPMDWA